MVHEQLHTFIHGFRTDAHPMSILCGMTGAIGEFFTHDKPRHP